MKNFVKMSLAVLVITLAMPVLAQSQTLDGRWRNQDYGKGDYHTDLLYYFNANDKLYATEETIIEYADSYEQEGHSYQGFFKFSGDQLCINLHSRENVKCYSFKWTSPDSFELEKEGEKLKFARAYSKKDKVSLKFTRLRVKAGLTNVDFSKAK